MKDYSQYKKLVIGCGIRKDDNAWNIDMLEDVLPDEVVDITRGLPYHENAFNEVIADYVLCQICNKKEFIFVMNEIWRVLDGVFKLKVPNAEFPVAFRDPMDCRYFTPDTFDHLNVDHYRYQVFNYGFLPWKILKIDKISGGLSPIEDRLSVEMSPVK